MPSPPFAFIRGPTYPLLLPFGVDGDGVAGAVTVSTGCSGSGRGQWKRSRLYALAASSMKASSWGNGEGTGMHTAGIGLEVAPRRPRDAANRWRSTVPVGEYDQQEEKHEGEGTRSPCPR